MFLEYLSVGSAFCDAQSKKLNLNILPDGKCRLRNMNILFHVHNMLFIICFLDNELFVFFR